VELGGSTVADTSRALQVLETSHPPVVYVPETDVAAGVLSPSSTRRTFCEFKGFAHYFDVAGGPRTEHAAAWGYADPAPGYETLRGHVAFYPGRMDRCLMDDEVVQAQAGDFYGGWITADVTGPFKGAPGTLGW